MTTPTGTHGERDNGDSPTYRAALEYVRRGWRVVALHWITGGGACSCGRPGCKAAGKHPIDKGWQRLETGDTPGRWLAGAPQNIGILTGKASGFWVLDFDPADVVDPADPADPGMALYHRLIDEGLEPHVRTGGYGLHYRFAMPADGRQIRNRQTAGGGAGRTHSLPRGWDVRGDGGQVVAPPSVSAKGAYVELIEGDDVAEPPPYVPPTWLLEMVTPPDHTVSTAEPLSAPAPPGGIAGAESGERIEGASHPAVRVQAYATGALQAECAEYSQLTDGRRGEAAAAFARSLHEIANLAGWDTTEGGEVYTWFSNAMTAAAGNNGGGGYGPHEVAGQWERAREHVGGRARVMPAALDVLPAPQVPAPAAGDGYADFRIVEPGAPTGGPGSTNAYAPPGGATGRATATTPAPSGPPPAPPVGMRTDVWREVLRLDNLEEAKRWRAARDAAGRPSLAARVLTGDTLDSVPDPVPLIDGWLFLDSTARINGKPGQGKSFVAADLLCSVATGTAWAGVPTRQGPVLAVVAEGVSGFKLRIRAWESDRGRATGAALHLVPFPVQTLDPQAWAELVAYAVSLRPVLITLDTQARMSIGARENDASDMGRVLASVEELRAATGACVLLVHHATKSGEGDAGRGSNAMEGGVTSEFAVSKSGHVVTVKTTRQKDIESDAKAVFALRSVDKSAVLTQQLEIVEPMGGEAWRMEAIALYEILRTGKANGYTWAELFRDAKESAAFSGKRTAFITHAWNNLLLRGLIVHGINSGDRAKFSVHVREEHGPDGVLTPNAGEWSVGDPGGWQTYRPDLVKNDADFTVNMGKSGRLDNSVRTRAK